MLKVWYYNSIYVLSNANQSYKKCLFTNTATIEYIKKQPTLSEKYKLHGLITREFLGLGMQNFQDIVFI